MWQLAGALTAARPVACHRSHTSLDYRRRGSSRGWSLDSKSNSVFTLFTLTRFQRHRQNNLGIEPKKPTGGTVKSADRRRTGRTVERCVSSGLTFVNADVRKRRRTGRTLLQSSALYTPARRGGADVVLARRLGLPTDTKEYRRAAGAGGRLLDYGGAGAAPAAGHGGGRAGSDGSRQWSRAARTGAGLVELVRRRAIPSPSACLPACLIA